MLSLPDGGGDIQDKSLEEIEKEFNPKTLAKINVDAVPIERTIRRASWATSTACAR